MTTGLSQRGLRRSTNRLSPQRRENQLMRNRILLFVSACLYYSGLIKLSRWWTRRSGRYLVILNYHRAAGEDLRQHLLYLRRHFRILHLEAALEALYAPPKEGLWRKDRRTPLVLT